MTYTGIKCNALSTELTPPGVNIRQAAKRFYILFKQQNALDFNTHLCWMITL